MKYICSNCNYIYDESIWDKTEWIKAGSNFWLLWDHYCCPNCYEDRDTFHEVIEEVNYIDINNNIDLIENDHFINVDIKDWNAQVSIWRNIHPSWEDHRITEIILLDEYWDIIETKFLAEEEEPIVDFDITDIDDFEIRTRCSVHWLWWIKINH